MNELNELNELLDSHESHYWNQSEAIRLCRMLELIVPAYGCHVALTGGLLYKDGPRKDCDLLFYRIRQVEKIDLDGLFSALALIDIHKTSGFGWVYKASFRGKQIDMFFPESKEGEYDPDYNPEPKK